MEKKIKIGFFTKSLEGGGAERVFVNLANSFCQLGYKVYIILKIKEGEYIDLVNKNIIIIPLKVSNPILQVRKLIKTINYYNLDLILSTPNYQNIYLLLAKKFINAKIIIREASTVEHLKKKNNKKLLKYSKELLLLFLMKSLYSKADLVIANSDGTLKELLRNVSISPNKAVSIRNPIYSNTIINLSNEQISDQHFFSLTYPLIVSVGRLEKPKNHHFLIESFALLNRKIPESNLIIIGKGSLENELKVLTKKHRIEKKVYFVGFVSNPYKYMKFCDVFVLSSYYEGFGNVLVEALALGVSVVSTDCPGGPREILDNGKYGALVPINNKEEMVKAIIMQLKKPKNDELLKERAKYYSIEKISEEYLSYIKKMDKRFA